VFLKVLRSTRPRVIFLVVLALGITWAGAFSDPAGFSLPVNETSPMPLYGLLKSLAGDHAHAGTILALALLSLMAVLMVYLNTTFFFISERTFLPALFYILLVALFPGNQVLNPVLPAAILLTVAFIRIMNAYREPTAAREYFDAAILISTGSLFYANIIWFGILLIVGMVLLRGVNPREIAISLIGLMTPYYFLIGVYLITGSDIHAFFSAFRDNLFLENEGNPLTVFETVIVVYAGLLLLAGAGNLVINLNSKKIKARKIFYFFSWVMFLSLALKVFLPSVSWEMVWITGIPASYFMVNHFLFARSRTVTDILFSLFFILVFIRQVMRIF
jgi:hypothetical protein